MDSSDNGKQVASLLNNRAMSPPPAEKDLTETDVSFSILSKEGDTTVYTAGAGDRLWQASSVFGLPLSLDDSSTHHSFAMQTQTHAARLVSAWQIKMTQDPKAFANACQFLLAQFLDMEMPWLDDRTVSLLQDQEAFSVFCSFLTRLRSDPSDTRPERDLAPQNIRRSYQVMDLLDDTTGSAAKLVDRHFEYLLLALMDSFLPHSDGHFLHIQKLLESLLRKHPQKVLSFLCLPRDNEKPLLMRMLKYVEQGPVASLLLNFLFPKVVREADRCTEFLNSLASQGFLEQLVERLIAGNEDENIDTDMELDSEAANPRDNVNEENENKIVLIADFWVRLVEMAVRHVDGIHLFASLRDSPDCLTHLVDGILRYHREEQWMERNACIEVIHAILRKSQERQPINLQLQQNVASLMLASGQTVASPLTAFEPVRAAVRVHLALMHVEALSIVLTGTHPCLNETSDSEKSDLQLSGYSVKQPFTISRMFTLELFYEAIRIADPKDTQLDATRAASLVFGLGVELVLDQIRPDTLRTLMSWFFEYMHNNQYHAMFYRIFLVILRANHIASLRVMLSKWKLLTKLIEHFKQSEKTDARGFIILILNTIRLSAASQHVGDYVPILLDSHHVWREFLPTLRKLTEIQWRGTFTQNRLAGALPDAFVSPLQSQVKSSSPREVSTPPSIASFKVLGAGGVLRSPLNATMQRPWTHSPSGSVSSYSGDAEGLDLEGIDLGSKYAHVLGFTAKPREGRLTPITAVAPMSSSADSSPGRRNSYDATTYAAWHTSSSTSAMTASPLSPATLTWRTSGTGRPLSPTKATPLLLSPQGAVPLLQPPPLVTMRAPPKKHSKKKKNKNPLPVAPLSESDSDPAPVTGDFDDQEGSTLVTAQEAMYLQNQEARVDQQVFIL